MNKWVAIGFFCFSETLAKYPNNMLKRLHEPTRDKWYFSPCLVNPIKYGILWKAFLPIPSNLEVKAAV